MDSFPRAARGVWALLIEFGVFRHFGCWLVVFCPLFANLDHDNNNNGILFQLMVLGRTYLVFAWLSWLLFLPPYNGATASMAQDSCHWDLQLTIIRLYICILRKYGSISNADWEAPLSGIPSFHSLWTLSCRWRISNAFVCPLSWLCYLELHNHPVEDVKHDGLHLLLGG